MPRRMMDRRMMDMRNPYGSAGGYVMSGRRGRRRGRDRGMDYEYDMAGRDYVDMARRDRAGDMARGRDYGDYEGSDMARGGGRDRGYDYGYDYAGDYGENLSREELEEWKKKLLKEVEEKDKQFFSKEIIGQKAKQMGVEMKDFNEEELVIATLLAYTDYCKTIKKYVGNNMDIYIELGKDMLEDKDASVKGGEKLAVYYDNIVEEE